MFSFFFAPQKEEDHQLHPTKTPPTSPHHTPPKLQLDKQRAGSQAPKGWGKKTTQNLTFDSISNCNSTNPTTRTAAAAAIGAKQKAYSINR
jgi:hypothetical protein